MHFTVNKVKFLNALQKIIGVIPSKTSIPILGSILVELSNNQLILTGTDLEISISTSLDVNSDIDGSLTIPGKLLFDIIRELPDIPIEVTSDDSRNITLKTDIGIYRLSGESKEGFPNIIIEDSDGEIVLNSNKLQRMISKTIFAVTTDELRTTLMGILVQILGDELRFVATDGHRLSKIVDKTFRTVLFDRQIIMPTKALNLLLKNIEAINNKEGEDISILIGENHATFRWKGTSIYTKLIEGKYPKYESVIPFDNDCRLIVDKESLISAVRRVAIFSNSITHQTRLILSERLMKICSEDIEFGGEANETLSIDYVGKEMEIGYNAIYLIDIIKHIDTKDVVLMLKNPKSAALIYPSEQKEGEDFQMLLMPIRLTDD